MRTQNFYLKLSLILVCAAMLAACGASKGSADSYDSSSRVSLAEVTTTDQTTRPFALCSQATGTYLNFGISVYQDGEVYSYSKVNFKLLKVPSYFSQSKNYIEFHKYMITPIDRTTGKGNEKIKDNERISFEIYSLVDGKRLVANASHLYWADLQSAAQAVNASTPEQFFKKVRIVLHIDDIVGEYDAISAKYFNYSDDSLVGETDGLIPVFDANPNFYANETGKDGVVRTRSPDLMKLHPFKDTSWTADVYKAKAHEFCKPIYTAQ